MVFKTAFIILNTALVTYLFCDRELIVTPIFLSIILIFQFADIIRSRKRMESKILTYLESIIYRDTTEKINSKKKIFLKMKNILKDYDSISSEEVIKNQEYRELMDNLLDNIKIGIIIFNIDNEVMIINKEARQILNIGFIEVFTGDIIDKIKLNKFYHYNINEFILNSKTVNILTIQDIKSAIDKNELESWNSLLRTLNHEIMNSITPISSLASSSLSIAQENSDRDLVEALEVIERRSKSLLSFVEKYRSISNIPIPDKKLININESFIHIKQLLMPMLNEFKAELLLLVLDKDLQLYADITLFENIIINLVKNSLEASGTCIEIKACFNNGYTIITIKDNGEGFSKEAIKKAFLPFYTTKSKGSGLGLSFVRQVLSMHNGKINIKNLDRGSIIELNFL